MIPFDIRPVRVRKPKLDVVSVRFDAGTFKKLCAYARKKKMILSEVMHQAALQLLNGDKKA